MNFAWSNLRVLALITLLRVGCLVRSGSVKLIGPKCEGEFDGSKVKCGSIITTDGDNEPFKLGSLCDNNKDLKLRIVRDDTNLDVTKFEVSASIFSVTECDDPTSNNASGEFSFPLEGRGPISNDLTADVKDLSVSSLQELCSWKYISKQVRIVFMMLDESGKMVEGQTTTSILVEVDCSSIEIRDVKLDVQYGNDDIPTVQVGDRNPFGEGTEIEVDVGSCYMPKTLACMYCGFDMEKEIMVGLDDDMWEAISTVEGRQSWATQWKEENGNDFFEKLHRVGLCETMHLQPLLDRSSISENGLGNFKLDRTFVPLPFAYDAMKEVYTNVDETRCAMIVTVDYLNQCADSNRSNNLAIFPINLKVDNVTVESVRSSVRVEWADAETGVAPNQVNKACTVLTNYLDRGTSAMLFPSPQNSQYEDSLGVLYRYGSFSPLTWYDTRFWVSSAMLKLSALNEDQCPAQCDEKYQKTQNIVGIHKRMIDMAGLVINQTDDLIQGMSEYSNTDFNNDLSKYKDISSLARKLATVFSKIPWVNREVTKMMMKMMKEEMSGDMDDDDYDDDYGNGYPRPGPRPPNRPGPNPLRYTLSDEQRQSGPFYIPKYQGMGMSCWEKGCDVETANMVCADSVAMGRLATINSPAENVLVAKLLRSFGKFEPDKESKTYYWFFNSLREKKINVWDSNYVWPGDRPTNFTNWGGDEPNDFNGMPEECTFIIPNTPGRNGPLSTHGPMWGDISCEAESFDWPKSNSRVVMVPICENIESQCMNGNGDFCHNQGICENFFNGTTKCHCLQNAYGERCQFLSDDYKKQEIPPTFPNLDGKDEICCRSMHARCIACSYGKSVDEFCSDPNNKYIVGCEGRGYDKGGNACNVDERPFSSVIESCDCTNMANSDCQLQFMKGKISCKYNVSRICLKAVQNWADSYLTASNANEPECRYQDPNYKGSQDTWESCASGKGYGEGGNACNLIEETFNSVEKACNCYTSWSSPDCQIQEIADQKFVCINNVSSSCLLAVKYWAEAFSTANIANDPKFMCDDLPLNLRRDNMETYKQEIWESCAPDNGMCVFDSYNNNSCEESYYSGPSGKCQDFKEDECGGEAINPVWPCCKWIDGKSDSVSFRGKRQIDDEYDDDMYPEENEEEESSYDMDDDSLKRRKRSSWGNKDKKQRNYGKESGSGGSESLGNAIQQAKQMMADQMRKNKQNFGNKYGTNNWNDGKDNWDDNYDKMKMMANKRMKGKGDGENQWRNQFESGQGMKDRYNWRNEYDEKRWDNMGDEKWRKEDNDDDLEDEWEDFMEDIMKCDGQKRCGKNKFLQELSSCICQSFWSRNSDPTGELCQAIPNETRAQLVKVITMFVKENGPVMPENTTMLWEFGRLGAMWKQHWEKLFILPFERKDMQTQIEMERDNLTEALNRWTEKGVANKDLSAPTLYRDLMVEWLNSESMMDISTNATQMIQGLMRTNMKRCNRKGAVGEAPSKEEFCLAYRAQKLADQYKCPLMKYAKELMRTETDMGPEVREIIQAQMKHLEAMGDGKGSCGKPNTGMMGNNIPIIWRKHMGNIVKGTFCELDGEWYWEKVATCGCKTCGGSRNDDWMNDDWMDDMKDNMDFDDMGDEFDGINFGR